MLTPRRQRQELTDDPNYSPHGCLLQQLTHWLWWALAGGPIKTFRFLPCSSLMLHPNLHAADQHVQAGGQIRAPQCSNCTVLCDGAVAKGTTTAPGREQRTSLW